MKVALLTGVSLLAASVAGQAWAQTTGAVDRAAGGYSFEEASQEDPNTKNHRSDDGVLTFAIVTHTGQ